MNSAANTAVMMAGSPMIHASLFHKIRFSVVDSVVYLELPQGERILILRDIEMDRARRQARVSRVHCPADFTPAGGLSGDRETANSQAAAECLLRAGIQKVIGDRALPLLYADALRKAGIEVLCDPDLGVIERRQKDAQEIEWLREAQAVTEQAIEMACRTIARADARADGTLVLSGHPLTSERVKALIDSYLLERGFANDSSIVASGPGAADCHFFGAGPIRTGEPVIVDVFPTHKTTHYCGDCTRTVVHGEVSGEILRMHQAVRAAKEAAEKTVKVGVTGEAVHLATVNSLRSSGFSIGLPGKDAPETYCAMTHGTGHGIGLNVHEPPLLDYRGPELLVGDALTIEPGLYCQSVGAVRLEDMIIVTEDGFENLNRLPMGLDWS